MRFASRVPGRLGLPELPGNLAEGVVLRPDARLRLEERPAVKHKIAEFDEARFDQARPFPARLSPADLPAVAAALVNPARVAGTRSKVGPGDPAALADEIVLDVLVDLLDAYPALGSAPEVQDVVRAVVVAHMGDSPG